MQPRSPCLKPSPSRGGLGGDGFPQGRRESKAPHGSAPPVGRGYAPPPANPKLTIKSHQAEPQRDENPSPSRSVRPRAARAAFIVARADGSQTLLFTPLKGKGKSG